MTRKRKCNSESNSFVAAAEQVCLQPVLEHRQRRGRHNIAGQAIPHLCSSNRKGTTSDSWGGVEEGQMPCIRLCRDAPDVGGVVSDCALAPNLGGGAFYNRSDRGPALDSRDATGDD